MRNTVTGVLRQKAKILENQASATVAKLVYFNIGAVLIYFQTGGWMTEQFPFQVPWWALLIAAEFIFLLYDWIFTKVAGWYYGTLRNRLVSTGKF